MGGIAVQYVALTRPDLVRRLILAGTTASVPGVKKYDDMTDLVGRREQPPPEPIKALTNASSESIVEGKKALAYSFFYDDDQGRAEFEKYWSRILQRNVDGEELILTLLDREATMDQWQTAVNANTPDPQGKGSFDRLDGLKMPVLVANGDNDVLIPSSRSWELYRLIENAALIMYPKAGHGFLWQYADMFGRHVNQFLDSEVFGGLGASKL